MTSIAEAAASFSCRLCDGHELRLYYAQGNDGRFRYYKCAQCGLVNLDLANVGLDQEQYTDHWINPMDDTHPAQRTTDASFDFLARYVTTPGQRLPLMRSAPVVDSWPESLRRTGVTSSATT